MEFQKYLESKNAKILSLLLEGKEKREIEKIFYEKDINILTGVVHLYNWKNGISNNDKIPIKELELFPEAIMLSIEDAVEIYDIYALNKKVWEPKFFPLFTNGGGDFILIDTDKSSKNMLYLFAPSLLLSSIPLEIYDSLENLFCTLIICFERGAYYVTTDKLFEVDYDLNYEISEKLNPHSKFWKS